MIKGDEILAKDFEYMSRGEVYFVYSSVESPRFIIPAKDRSARKFVLRMLSADKGLLGMIIRVILNLPGGTALLSAVIFRKHKYG